MPYKGKYSRRRSSKRKMGRSYKKKNVSQPGGVGWLRSARAHGPTRPICAPGDNTIVFRKMRNYSSSACTSLLALTVPAGNGYAFAITATGFTSWSTISPTWDQYAIVNVKFTFIPQSNVFAPIVSGGNTISGMLGMTCLVVDTDGTPTGGTPSAKQDVLRHETAVIKRHDQYITSGWFAPKPSPEFYAGIGPSGFGIPKTGELQWLDVASSGVEHYGVQLWIDPPQQSSTIVRYDVLAEAVFAFRHGI